MLGNKPQIVSSSPSPGTSCPYISSRPRHKVLYPSPGPDLTEESGCLREPLTLVNSCAAGCRTPALGFPQEKPPPQPNQLDVFSVANDRLKSHRRWNLISPLPWEACKHPSFKITKQKLCFPLWVLALAAPTVRATAEDLWPPKLFVSALYSLRSIPWRPKLFLKHPLISNFPFIWPLLSKAQFCFLAGGRIRVLWLCTHHFLVLLLHPAPKCLPLTVPRTALLRGYFQLWKMHPLFLLLTGNSPTSSCFDHSLCSKTAFSTKWTGSRTGCFPRRDHQTLFKAPG